MCLRSFMRSRAWCFAATLLILSPLAAQYHTALPGYRYEFPRDHFNHPDYQTEWWYYTGNLKSADGHRYGFELTFFRQAVGRVWNGNWRIQWEGSNQRLVAIDARFQLNLTLRSEKAPVIHGENGVSQKADGPGRASHYISLTRLATFGSIELGGKSFKVSGTSWMDHEFFTHQLEPNQTGWDWLSLQLADHTELMLFHIRRADGSIDPYSAGTYVDAQGRTTHLRSGDFSLQPLGKTWTI